MAEETTTTQGRDIVSRRLDLVPRLRRQMEKRTVHQHAPQLRHPDWTNYTNQRYVRDLAIDSERGWLWMATWGGILCWQPEKELCWRYTSEQGLSGNATRCLTIDSAGIVWAGGQEVGLYSFHPERDPFWRCHRDLENWTVSCLVPRPEGGIYMALENANSQCALGELTSPESDLRLLVEKGLAIRDIATLLVDEQGALWLGNPWGLHCWRGTGEPESFELENKQVRALAEAVGGGLWLGTNWGLYRFQVGGEPWQSPDWTREEIFSLAMDSETGDLWAITATGVGRITDGSWHPVSQANSPPGQLTSAIALPCTLKPQFGEGTVLIGGANRLYLTSIDSSEPALTGSDEDTLSNAVHCLWADETAVWVGTARGLHRFDGKGWHSYGADAPNLRDVRTFLPDGEKGRLWVGTFRIGLQRIEQGVYIPDSVLKTPIISLTASPDGTLWAATFDTIYCRPSGQKDWQPILHPAAEHIGPGLIQTICHQVTEGTATLWVGTSSGLFRYRPQLGLWDAAQDFAAGELEHISIQVLAIDPFFQQLWIGTPQGLFSELNGQFSKLEGFGLLDVRSLAFSEDRKLWVGTPSGLFSFPLDKNKETFWKNILLGAKNEQKEPFSSTNSGIASKIVTALSVRKVDLTQEIWIGTPRGVCCYRYSVSQTREVQ